MAVTGRGEVNDELARSRVEGVLVLVAVKKRICRESKDGRKESLGDMHLD